MIIVQRVAQTEYGTFGVMMDTDNYIPFATTIERPWKNNAPNISSIPAGYYKAKRVTRSKHGNCFELQDVPKRYAILIHVANFPTDVSGCIGIATGFGEISGKPAVVSSRAAYESFMLRMEGKDEFDIKVI